eukprot:scaffold23202_cov66-Skeletonema_marinoi.AAC.2
MPGEKLDCVLKLLLQTKEPERTEDSLRRMACTAYSRDVLTFRDQQGIVPWSWMQLAPPERRQSVCLH